jgi:thioredoxin reductase (NADPH)
MPDVLDVLIVGGGAAGYTAGLFAARDRCRALLLEKFSSGGQVLNCEHITNFPGFPQGVAGYTLGPLLQEQATTAGLQIAMNEVTAVRRDGDLLRVETDGGSHISRTLIIASGSRFTTLGVPGEEAFIGRGLSHCASCDGSFFMEKPVIVVGGGDAAVDEALHLTQYASSVTVLHRRDTLRACASLRERAREARKLSFRWNTALRAIEGADGVERVQVEDLTSGETEAVPASCVFIYAGLTPNTEFLDGLVPCDERGQIVTDLRMRTRVPGILAAGDVRAESARQLVTSAGDGATAALAAVQYLRDGRWPA